MLFNSNSLPKSDSNQSSEDLAREDKTNGTPSATVVRPEIPEELFIEHSRPRLPKATPETEHLETCDIHTLYRYLERDLEKKGYEDALVNPDTAYLEEQILHIKSDLRLLISKIKTYYVRHLNDVKFHIESRQRQLLIETVEELIAYRSTIEEEIKIVGSIESDARDGAGLTENLILGYKKGFKNGFAAITYNTILGRR